MITHLNKIRTLETYKLINDIIKILNDNNIFYLPVGGTILGLERDGCILPYDDDADMIFKLEDESKIKDLFIKNNYIIHTYDWHKNVFAVKYKDRIFHDDDYVFIDFFYVNKEKEYLINTWDKVKCDSSCIIKKDFYKIKNINFMCNQHLKEYLVWKFKDYNKYIMYNHHVNGRTEITLEFKLLDLIKTYYEKNIITFGTFDLFHIGHLNVIKYIRDNYKDYKLIVGVSSDKLNYEKKKSYPAININNRLEIIKNIKGVDEVFIEHKLEDKLKYCINYNASILVMGDDHLSEYDYLKDYFIDVVYIPRTKNISTTQIKKQIKLNKIKNK